MVRKLASSVLIFWLASAIPDGLLALERQQLPVGVRPFSYDLSLFPDETNLQFRGQVKIMLDVKAATSSIVLNDDELTLDKAALDTSETPSSIRLDNKLQRATLTFEHSVAAGRHTLTIDYHGVIGRATEGFFAMDYDGPAGKRRTIATNFEPTFERRFMPSWDEPGIKATLRLSVDVPADRMAIANMPAVSTETLPDGKKRVHFATTPKMSTYLYFLAIGDFERITGKSDGTEVGVVVNRGDAEKGQVALREAVQLLHYYNGYFGVPFPLPKLDLVVAPGEITGASMENWGAIFYSQDDLLFDPARSTEADRQLVFLVVSHEMAHQWFGDLVTMAWWDDLWLNEGFARWMQTKAADDLHPQWKTGLQALGIAEAGKRADAKPSTHPIVQTVLDASQAAQAFDNITYDKGASVIGMLEAYVGPASFRNGVRRYMRAHAYGNTVDADFWREIQAAAGKPLLEIEANFTRQPGLPLIRVEQGRATGGGKTVELREGRFAEDPATIASAATQQWQVPVTVSAGGEAATYLLSGTTPVTVPVRGDGPVIVNTGQSAFARTIYPEAMIQALSKSVGQLKSSDQLGLLYDSWALGQSGYEPVTDYLDIAGVLPTGADPVVWMQVIKTLISIDRAYTGNPRRAAFLAYARKLHPLAAKLGWDAIRNEESNDANLRDAVLKALGRFGDQAVIAEATRRFEQAMRDSKSTSPAVRRTAISIVAYHADRNMLNRLIATLRATRDPLEKQNLLSALAGIADSAGAERVVQVGMEPDAPAGFAPYLLAMLSQDHPNLTWKLALQHVDRPDFPLDSMLRLILMPAIAGNSSERQRIADLKAYADQHLPATARKPVEAAISSIELNAKFKAERIPEIDKWLAKKTN
jgi:aminopeptidase N